LKFTYFSVTKKYVRRLNIRVGQLIGIIRQKRIAMRNTLIYFSGNYIHWKGIEITGNTQDNGSYIYVGQYAYASSNCIFELLNIHHNGMGFWLRDDKGGANSNNNLILNCDIHHNADPITNGDPYGNGDGLGININIGNTVTIRGCRIYYNSDDGLDPYGSDATIIIDKCWFFYNGLEFDTFNWQHDASGIKYGGTNTDHGNTVLYPTTNCISYRNSWIGFNTNGALAAVSAYNCISALNGGHNGTGQGFQLKDPDGRAHILKNNISYNDNSNSISSTSTVIDNTFLVSGNTNTAYTLSSADFVSLDPSGLTSARQSDGSLPNIDFLHLAPGSRLIDAGVDVGLPFSGKAPDLGPFEAQTGSTTPIPVPSPMYISSVVENASPTLLEMTYNITLANVVPSASTFSVIVNSVVRGVNAIAISGTRVQLTLANAIKSGDIVTVSYTKPATNPIQTPSGGTATGITTQPVNNNCRNISPTAVITSPIINSSFTSVANITISATALDADGSVSLVEFYNGNTKLGSKSEAPYSFIWTNVPAGTYSLTVVAIDNLNSKTTSAAITISVINAQTSLNKHPVVKISNPRKGNVFENLSTIMIDAIATDPDGTVTKVEFFNGSVRLVELTTAPYSFTWKDVAAGSYSIKAIATDNSNDTTISAPVEFVVGSKVKYDANSDIIKLYPNPNDGHFSIAFINPLQNEKSDIVITDMAGKQVYNGPVLKEETLKQIDLSDSKSGIYIMMIKNKEILVTKKFIKK